MALQIAKWCYNPSYRSCEPSYNWLGAHPVVPLSMEIKVAMFTSNMEGHFFGFHLYFIQRVATITNWLGNFTKSESLKKWPNIPDTTTYRAIDTTIYCFFSNPWCPSLIHLYDYFLELFCTSDLKQNLKIQNDRNQPYHTSRT